MRDSRSKQRRSAALKIFPRLEVRSREPTNPTTIRKNRPSLPSAKNSQIIVMENPVPWSHITGTVELQFIETGIILADDSLWINLDHKTYQQSWKIYETELSHKKPMVLFIDKALLKWLSKTNIFNVNVFLLSITYPMSPCAFHLLDRSKLPDIYCPLSSPKKNSFAHNFINHDPSHSDSLVHPFQLGHFMLVGSSIEKDWKS